MIRVPRTPGPLVAVGAVLLWVISPLSLGGLITVGVRTHNAGGIGGVAGAGLLVWGLISLLVLLAGFGALLAGVLIWWRERRGGEVLLPRRFEATRPRDDDPELEERLGF